MVAVPAAASDYEVNAGTRRERTKAVYKGALTQLARFGKHYWVLLGEKQKPFGTPRMSTLFFLVTRFIDALQLRRAISISAGKEETA